MQINLNTDSSNIIKEMSLPDTAMHFSQLGEDCFLWHYFHLTYSGFYVDVGAHDPRRYSNTQLLHRFRKWSGINIDADVRAISKFIEQRPDDTNLNVGVGLEVGELDFTVFQDGAINTFDKELANRQSANFSIATVLKVPVETLAQLLMANVPEGRAIDYLNVDCEGLDHEVLASNDWEAFRPLVISVEIHNFDLMDAARNKTVQLLTRVGYRFIAHYLVTSFFERVRP